jgi:hypothetical protein
VGSQPGVVVCDRTAKDTSSPLNELNPDIINSHATLKKHPATERKKLFFQCGIELPDNREAQDKDARQTVND